MFTPFDTSHLYHRANRHVPAGQAARTANHQSRARRRAAWRAVVAQVFLAASHQRTMPKSISPRA
ncbi:hypothetical protein KUV73_13495 [Mameliella alba]|nr:hypothetical protein [Mameliella alba]MBY6170368.1 hypothetical protein [Mameliella alba]MBY6175386.1 hypothetical protein [Mameliella alba]